VLILGAGGAVRGVLGPAAGTRAARVTIANRTPDKARKLAAEFADMGPISGCGFAEIARTALRSHHQCHLGRPAGRNARDAGGLVGEETVCYDMAYGRGDTPLHAWAKSLHAARTTKGWGMLVEQAAESFLLWRGIRPEHPAGARRLSRSTHA
jgi:shikimate dehydrogenase